MRESNAKVHRCVIVGAGIAGLSCAYFLQHYAEQRRIALQLTVLEQAEQAGGNLRSHQQQGYVIDWAANGMLSNAPDTQALAEAMGLPWQEASAVAKKRYLYYQSSLRPVPLSPPALLSSDLLPPLAKLRALYEYFTPRASVPAAEADESVYDFLARHFGRAVAEVFAAPFVAGITAGDPQQLSLGALFPQLRQLEQKHSSLLKGLLAKGKPKDPMRLRSFAGGTGALPTALAQHLASVLQFKQPVHNLQRQGEQYVLQGEDGYRLEADSVVLATPAFASANILAEAVPASEEPLRAIPYAGVQVLALGFDRIDVPDALDGFGFLVAPQQGLRSLGVLYSSSIFPNQAPEGKVALRVILGGSRDPELLDYDEAALLAVVRRDLCIALGIVAEPEMVAHIRWPQGIPQYTLGHQQRLEKLQQALAEHPRLRLTGNAYHGVSVNDSIRSAKACAASLIASLSDA